MMQESLSDLTEPRERKAKEMEDRHSFVNVVLPAGLWASSALGEKERENVEAEVELDEGFIPTGGRPNTHTSGL